MFVIDVVLTVENRVPADLTHPTPPIVVNGKIVLEERIALHSTGAAAPLVERAVVLRAIDTLWVEHLTELEDFRRGVGLRGYGGRDPLIEFKDRGNYTQVATFPDEPFASYFSGNVAQICPVGALTAKPYRFKARPWDLEQADSTCTTCSAIT